MEKVGTLQVRQGTRVDGGLLTELFTKMKFDVEHLFNYTALVCFCAVCKVFIIEPFLAFFFHFCLNSREILIIICHNFYKGICSSCSFIHRWMEIGSNSHAMLARPHY